MPEVDLARLAEGYRYRRPSDASLERARKAGEAIPAGSMILDAGGGPGHHSAVWAAQGHHPVVLDPSAEMIRPVVEGGLMVVLGVSQSMPFQDRVFDLVWFHLSLHYGDWQRAVDESTRVARDGGSVEIWTLAADHHAASLLARWFPSVPQIDDERFPDSAEVEAFLFDRAASVTRTGAIEHKTRTAGDWLTAAEAGFVSTLQLLEASELEAGLAAFRDAYPDPADTVDYELRFDRIVALL